MKALRVLSRGKSLAKMQSGDTSYVISRVTGKILKTDENAKKEPVPTPTYSLDDSLAYLEASYQKGELAATNGVRAAIRRMREEADRLDELLLLQEVDGDLRYE